MKVLFKACTWVAAIVLASGIALCAHAAGTAGDSTASLADVRALFHLNGSEAAAEAMLNSVVLNATTWLDQGGNPLPPDSATLALRDSMSSDLRKEFPGYLESLVSLYASHFSRDDVRALIAFYQSPIGQKLARETPQISVQALRAGQEWSERILPILQRRVAAWSNEQRGAGP